MNVQSIDLGHKLRQGVHFCLDLAPVVFRRPIARQRLNRRELYSLGCICNRFSFRPLCRVDAPAQFGEFPFRNTHMKQTNRILVSCLLPAACSTSEGHGVLHWSSLAFGGCGLCALHHHSRSRSGLSSALRGRPDTPDVAPDMNPASISPPPARKSGPELVMRRVEDWGPTTECLVGPSANAGDAHAVLSEGWNTMLAYEAIEPISELGRP